MPSAHKGCVVKRARHASPCDHDPLMTTAEVAAYLRVPVTTIHYWRHLETAPRAMKVGKHLRWRRTDIDAWLDEQAA